MAETLNQRWAATLAGAMAAAGVRHAVIAPGSRSAPLALAFADRPDVRCWSVIDERSAAFFALGLAKATQRPAAVLATSGTAGAHFLPAAMEAAAGSTPLVIITADRPWELHGFGAPQTADQSHLFGGHARATELLAAPDDAPEALAHLAAVVARTVARAVASPRGPVHLNVPFREPLAPSEPGPGPIIDPRVPGFGRDRPVPDVSAVVAALRDARRGLIVCGPREDADGLGELLHRLGERLGLPVLADAASNARYGCADAIAMADAMLRSARFARGMRPDLVLRFGGGLTQKRVQAWLDASGARTFLFSDDGLLFDPMHQAEAVLTGDLVAACTRLLDGGPGDGAWRQRFLAANAAVEARLESLPPELTEPLVARELVRALPDGAQLVLASSMPIRDVDAFAPRARGQVRVFANRGVNGIDGLTSTALGIAAAARRPTVLLTGDLALLHDLHGWVTAKRHALPLTVVAVDNDGGGIFHHLPIAEQGEHFESLFATPHGVDLEAVADLGGARLHRPADAEAFRRCLVEALEGGLHLVQVRTDRRKNAAVHRDAFRHLVGPLEEGPAS